MELLARIFGKYESCEASEFSKKESELIDRAKKEILITTSLQPKFYNKREIKNSFENAIEKGVNIKIMVTNRNIENLNEIDWLKEKVNKGKVLIRSIDKEIAHHTIIVDRKHIRRESYHEEEDWEKAKNTIGYYVSVFAGYYADIFDLVWKEAEPVKPDAINIFKQK